MDWKSFLISLLIKIVLFTVYFIGYIVLAALFTGGGHGNFYLFAPVAPLLLVFVAVLLLGNLHYKPLKIIFVCLMLAHYVWTVYSLANYDFEADKGWKYGLGAAILPIIWYVLGQIVVWKGFAVNLKENESEKNKF